MTKIVWYLWYIGYTELTLNVEKKKKKWDKKFEIEKYCDIKVYAYILVVIY